MSEAKRIGVIEARAKFCDLVRQAGDGGEFEITRNGRVVAKIVPAGPQPNGKAEQPPVVTAQPTLQKFTVIFDPELNCDRPMTPKELEYFNSGKAPHYTRK